MSNTPERPGATPDFAAYAALDRQRAETAEAIRPANKATLFDALARIGVARVTVTFDGSCDDGQIESVDAFGAEDTTVSLAATGECVPIRRALWDGSAAQTQELTVAEAIEALAYDLLEETHGGWENDDGGYGEFTFDVAARTITLEYNERVVQTEYHEHEF